jgi:DNA-directed RNA polymerase-5 subunit 1
MHEKNAKRCHPNSLGCVVSSCSWGKHAALSTESFLRISNENQLKSNKEYDDGLYAILALVKTDQEKARYTFLEDVQQPGRLPEQNSIVEKLKIRMVSWKIEDQNGIRKQP